MTLYNVSETKRWNREEAARTAEDASVFLKDIFHFVLFLIIFKIIQVRIDANVSIKNKKKIYPKFQRRKSKQKQKRM